MAQLAHGGEKAEAHILAAEMGEQVLQQRLVVAVNQAQSDRGAVARRGNAFEIAGHLGSRPSVPRHSASTRCDPKPHNASRANRRLAGLLLSNT